MSIRSHRARGRPAARLVRLAALALALPALTGAAFGNSAAERPSRAVQELDCTDPDPCGYVWAGAFQEPFQLERVEEVVVEGHDGTELHGWLAFPTLDVMRAPVALHSSPYMGLCSAGAGGCVPNPSDPSFWSDDPHAGVTRAWGVPPIELIRGGYVAAFFAVRGTGGSAGCVDWFGEDETRDQKVLVDWLARQSWSNGRVGMGGNSYPGTTPWQAAVQAPPGLKTIVTAGIVTDFYSFFHTRQGMQHVRYPAGISAIETSTTWLPHAGGVGSAAPELVRIAERAAVEECPASPLAGKRLRGPFLRERDPAFWEPRRYQDRLDQVRASVLMAPGLQDVTGHAFQDMLVWRPCRDPRRSRASRAPGPARRPRLRCGSSPVSGATARRSRQLRR